MPASSRDFPQSFGGFLTTAQARKQGPKRRIGSFHLRNGDDKVGLRLETGQNKPMLTTLADLLSPVSLSEFLEVFRARKRLHISASDPTRAEMLFSWRDIDTLLSGHVLDENVKIMRDGVRIPRQLYTSNEGKRLNVRAFHDLLPQGVSIVVDEVHRSIPQIEREEDCGPMPNDGSAITAAFIPR